MPDCRCPRADDCRLRHTARLHRPVQAASRRGAGRRLRHNRRGVHVHAAGSRQARNPSPRAARQCASEPGAPDLAAARRHRPAQHQPALMNIPSSGEDRRQRRLCNESWASAHGRERLLRMTSRLKNQSGMALVMAVGVLAVLTISGTTLVAYTTSNARSGSLSKTNELAFSLAETGLNNAMAVLSNPDNDSLQQSTLPQTEATASSASYEGGTAKWYGVLDRPNALWTITAIGLYKNPTGTGVGDVRRQLTAQVPIQPTYTQPLNNPV